MDERLHMQALEEFQLQHSVLLHPSIIRAYGLILHEGHLGIVMEYANGGDLYHLIPNKHFRNDTLLQYEILATVAEGIEFIHMKGVLYRDVKPHNVLIITRETGLIIPKLIDFGESRRIQVKTPYEL